VPRPSPRIPTAATERTGARARTRLLALPEYRQRPTHPTLERLRTLSACHGQNLAGTATWAAPAARLQVALRRSPLRRFFSPYSKG
jgi:hypothetical protein